MPPRQFEFTRENTSSASEVMTILRPLMGVYVVAHLPTRAMFFGKTLEMARAFLNWHHRLRSLDTDPPLNVAFRAVWTIPAPGVHDRGRQDFRFMVLHKYQIKNQVKLDGGDADRDLNAAIVAARALGPYRCLNCDGSAETRKHWQSMVLDPKERVERFAYDKEKRQIVRKHRVGSRKIKLVPGRIQERGMHSPLAVAAPKHENLFSLRDSMLAAMSPEQRADFLANEAARGIAPITRFEGGDTTALPPLPAFKPVGTITPSVPEQVNDDGYDEEMEDQYDAWLQEQENKQP